jgi:polyisoprenoid-binding protein YceI
MKKPYLAIALALGLLGTPAMSQTAGQRTKPSAVQAGSYRVDPDHTQVIWSVDHMGFSRLYGMVGGMSGTLNLDPERPSEAKLEVDIQLSGLTVTSPGFAVHLKMSELFDVGKFPDARFVSRMIAVHGEEATITGDLTLRGETKPAVLNARFHGTGTNPMNKAQTVGFSAKGQVKRSDFGLGYGVPAVSDLVELEITAAFEKTRD